MACQAVVAFVSELAQVAFLALPRAVVAIAGSQWRVCQRCWARGVLPGLSFVLGHSR